MRRSFAPFVAALACLASAAHAAPVTVTPADAPVIKRAVAARKGHVVVVNFWATWCGPCVAEFPTLVKFARQHKAKGLDLLTVSADQSKDMKTKVVPFLTKQKVAGPAFLERASDPEDFINAFDRSWQGELPKTLIYDRKGKLVKSLSGAQTEQSLRVAMKGLL